MLDLPALPIAIALTLWDAAPIFLSISLALAIVTRALAHGPGFQWLWSLRESFGVEGIVYLALFEPELIPALAVSAGVLVHVRLREPDPGGAAPRSPATALRVRADELVLPLLISSAIAATVKISGPDIDEHGVGYAVLAACLAGTLAGNRSGAVAIPAVAVAVHMGGIIPAMACVAAATLRKVIGHRWRRRHRAADAQ